MSQTVSRSPRADSRAGPFHCLQPTVGLGLSIVYSLRQGRALPLFTAYVMLAVSVSCSENSGNFQVAQTLVIACTQTQVIQQGQACEMLLCSAILRTQHSFEIADTAVFCRNAHCDYSLDVYMFSFFSIIRFNGHINISKCHLEENSF